MLTALTYNFNITFAPKNKSNIKIVFVIFYYVFKRVYKGWFQALDAFSLSPFPT